MTKPTRSKVEKKQQEKKAANDENPRQTQRSTGQKSDNVLFSFLRGLAIFGDSSLALLASFLLMMSSVAVALWLDGGFGSFDFKLDLIDPLDVYIKVSSIINPPYIFQVETKLNNEASYSSNNNNDLPHVGVSEAMRTAFERDGVIAVRGLIPIDLLDRLDLASALLIQEQEKKKKNEKPKGAITGRKLPGKQFHTVRMSTIFRDPSSLGLNDTTTTTTMSPFQEVAFLGQIPLFAAQLLNMTEDGSGTVRLMKDIFLAKDEEQYTCGWHVDDVGFWPAIASDPGVSAWIALDDMPTNLGGGFALATGSHKALWRDEAYYVTGSTHTMPKEGYKSAADLFQNRPGNGTCNIKTAAPHLYRKMEYMKRVYEIQRGDVIFHTRWLFHRTVPFHKDAIQARKEKNLAEPIYRRLSLRYGPGSSEIPRGYGTEPSVLWNETNGGRTADEVCQHDGPWYPKVWPSTSSEELEQITDLALNKIPVAEKRAEVRKKQMRPFLMNKNKPQH